MQLRDNNHWPYALSGFHVESNRIMTESTTEALLWLQTSFSSPKINLTLSQPVFRGESFVSSNPINHPLMFKRMSSSHTDVWHTEDSVSHSINTVQSVAKASETSQHPNQTRPRIQDGVTKQGWLSGILLGGVHSTIGRSLSWAMCIHLDWG